MVTKLIAIKKRTISLLLATLILGLLVPSSPVNADDPALDTVTDFVINGVTPPVPGATPTTRISETDNEQYTGAVAWESYEGALIGNFETNTVYAAIITLTLVDGYTIEGLSEYFFEVPSSTRVTFNPETMVIKAYFAPTVGGVHQYLDTSFGENGSINVRDIFGENPLNDTGTAVGPIKVDKIAVDSEDRIVVLASFYDDSDVDNHMLFRLTADGLYDENFGNREQSLRKDISDSPKPYVLVTTTCPFYSERVDLEIDSQDNILVLISGSAVDGGCSGGHHNFIVRYTESGYIDEDFGNLGVIGNLEPQFSTPESLFDQFSLDSFDNIVTVSLSSETQAVFVVEKFSPNGSIDTGFGEGGSVLIDVDYPMVEPGDAYLMLYRYSRIVSDDNGGYLIAFSAVIEPSPNLPYLPFTELFNIDSQGNLKSGFNDVVLPFFLLTDLIPDGPSGFILSGSYLNLFGGSSDFLARILRMSINGEIDVDFSDLAEINLSGTLQEDPLLRNKFSDGCINLALLGNESSNESIVGVMAAELCWYGGGRIKAFSSLGVFQGVFNPIEFSNNPDSMVINQLISTRNGRLLMLSGATPNTGALDLMFTIFESSDAPEYWMQATISRYLFSETKIPITYPQAPIYTPTPVPYLKTLSLPKLNLRDGKLVCSAGTYNTGFTLDGVIQGSSTSLFTPATYVYNLIVNGIAQAAFAVTSANPTTSWDMPSAISGSLITCSVTVTANGVTNSDRSSDNAAGVSAAKASLSASISKADSDYSALLTANEKAYQKALIDNRSKWRNDADTLRKNYQAEISAIRALPSTKETRGSSLAALKNYTAAVKKNSADYKASKPAALAERDAANKTALAAKSAAVASANDAYGIFIESIGYGVLVP